MRLEKKELYNSALLRWASPCPMPQSESGSLASLQTERKVCLLFKPPSLWHLSLQPEVNRMPALAPVQEA